jgi:hypothetical protein
MSRHNTDHDSELRTVRAQHSHRRAIRLVALLSSVALWRVVATPSRTCESLDVPTTDATPALAYFSVTSITLGTRTFVISFSSSNVMTAIVRNRPRCAPTREPLTAAENVPP